MTSSWHWYSWQLEIAPVSYWYSRSALISMAPAAQPSTFTETGGEVTRHAQPQCTTPVVKLLKHQWQQDVVDVEPSRAKPPPPPPVTNTHDTAVLYSHGQVQVIYTGNQLIPPRVSARTVKTDTCQPMAEMTVDPTGGRVTCMFHAAAAAAACQLSHYSEMKYRMAWQDAVACSRLLAGTTSEL